MFLKLVFVDELIFIFYWFLYIVLLNEVSVEELIKFKIKERVRVCVYIYEIIYRSIVWFLLVKVLLFLINVLRYIY